MAMAFSLAMVGNAQIGNKMKGAIQKPSTVQSSARVRGAANTATGKVLYVNAARGTVRGAGTKDAPMKDIQKAVDNATDGDKICIAEGNYLGSLDRGWIEMKGKYVSLEGGWNSNFTERNPVKYVTKIQPNPQTRGTINGSAGCIHLEGNDRSKSITIDGIFIDMGNMNEYRAADPSNPQNGCPQGCETGEVKPLSNPNVSVRGIGGRLAGKLIIRNCMFTNCTYFGIIMTNSGGEWEIYNNVFVSNFYGAVEISGGLNQQREAHASKVDFHHNTVMFSWTRTKAFEDMGYGYRFRNGCDHNVHHNIFGCNSWSALDAAWIDDHMLKPDQKKVLIAEDNRFFMNKADIMIPGGGTNVYAKADRFEEVEQLKGYERNAEIANTSKFKDVIDPAYLKGFASIKVMRTENYDPNSAANQYRSAMGLNQVGTSNTTVSMWGNRYNFEKAKKFFGAEKGYGAQGF